jgi:Mrp family chromosome partitioning ATPase
MVSQFWSEVVWDDLDVMLIDMPPGTGDVALTVFQSLPVDGVVIVTSPQELVSLIVSKSVKMAEMMNIKVVGIVENMAYFQCPECGKKYSPFVESHCDEIAKKFNIPLVAKLPLNPELAKLSDHGRIEFAESSELTELVHHIIQLEERK